MVEVFGFSFGAGSFIVLCILLGVAAGWLTRKSLTPVIVVQKQCVHTIPKEYVDEYMASPQGKELVEAILSGKVQAEQHPGSNGPGGVEM